MIAPPTTIIIPSTAIAIPGGIILPTVFPIPSTRAPTVAIPPGLTTHIPIAIIILSPAEP